MGQSVEVGGKVGYLPIIARQGAALQIVRHVLGPEPIHESNFTHVIFTGTYEHAIDAKNRMAIPADIRSQLVREQAAARTDANPDAGPINLYATLGEGRTLCLYTEAGFEQRANELDKSELDPVQLLAYERVLFSLSRKLELDGSGRLRLPDHLLQRCNLGDTREIIILGAKDHLEIHDRNVWNQTIEQLLDDQPELLMNPRLAMRKKSD